MSSDRITCIKRVGGFVMCSFCTGEQIKYGFSASGEQRFRCKNCKKSQVRAYKNKAYLKGTDQSIIDHLKEGCGMRSISRLLGISVGTVTSRIIKISKNVKSPLISLGKEYEVDEIRTFVAKKSRLIWVAYAIEKDSKEVVSFNVGRRTKNTLNLIIETLKLSQTTKIYTDKLNCYKALIGEEIHSTKNRGTNYIERNHLTLRTHLKRLNRRTICFSKSIAMLTACLRIYFWG